MVSLQVLADLLEALGKVILFHLTSSSYALKDFMVCSTKLLLQEVSKEYPSAEMVPS